MTPKMGHRVGILAVQGDVEAHVKVLARLGAEGVRILRPEQLRAVEAVILPGGESTTIAKGLDRLQLWDPLCDFAGSGRPVLGTCAGAILLAKRVANHPVRTLGLLDMTASRNAYGTQVDSFAAEVDQGALAGLEGLPCVFIRAPRLSDLGPEVEVLACVDGSPVFVRQGNVIACAFHPELTDDLRVHRQLLGNSADWG